MDTQNYEALCSQKQGFEEHESLYNAEEIDDGEIDYGIDSYEAKEDSVSLDNATGGQDVDEEDSNSGKEEV